MSLRDKLNARVTPLLEPGEQPQVTFVAQGGANPWLANSFGLVGRAILAKPRIVCGTDRAIVVLEANLNGTSPTKVLSRLPRETRIGPVKGLWSPITLAGERLYVGKRFHKDVDAIDGVTAS
jgi:hypothetical protein